VDILIMKRATFLRRTAPMLAGAAFLAGCMDLTVPNENTPSISGVYSDPASLESAVGTSFRVIWGVTQGDRANSSYPGRQLAALGEETTSADANVMVVNTEPRTILDNADAGGWTNRKPWYDLYEAIATTTQALRVLDAGLNVGPVSAEFPDGRDTERARAFAKFNQALGHIYIGLLFDQGFVTDETVDPAAAEFVLVPYEDVLAHGIELMDEAITLSLANEFTLPLDWVNQQTITNEDLAKIGNSYVARALAYGARNPEERAAVDWQEVLARVNAGITTPFGQQADAAIEGTTSAYIQATQLMTNARADNRLIGPADVSGAYQAWIATPLDQRKDFRINTPDRRIQGTGGPGTNGTIFGYLSNQTMSSVRGTYMHSRYRGIQFGTTHYNRGFIVTMSPTEMDFLRAEALIRLDREEEAVTIINKYRVANGKLPAVTVDGPPEGPDCVPKRDDGTCGDLWDTLMYEKRIETFATEPIIPFADARGWGRMLPGTLVHFPVHGRELETLGLPIYTFGPGLGGVAPDNWPINGIR
jgi:hypothetical protein